MEAATEPLLDTTASTPFPTPVAIAFATRAQARGALWLLLVLASDGLGGLPACWPAGWCAGPFGTRNRGWPRAILAYCGGVARRGVARAGGSARVCTWVWC